MLLAQFYKMAKVEVIIPTEASLFLFVHIPKDIDGDNRQSAGFHLQHRLFPLCTRETAVMELTGNGYHGASVFGHIVTVYFHTSSVGGSAAQLQVSGVYLFRSDRFGQLVCLLGAQAQCAGQSQQEGKCSFHIFFFFERVKGVIAPLEVKADSSACIVERHLALTPNEQSE